MTSVQCVTSTGSRSDREPTALRLMAASLPAPPLVALAFSHDGTRAAYAVRRGKALRHGGKHEDACCIFIASTNAPVPSASSNSSAPGAAVAPFAQWTVLQVLASSHDAPITALGWCRRTGALLSVSADRSACVWVPRSDADAAQAALQTSNEEGFGTASVECGSACPSSSNAADAPFCAVPQLVMLSADVRLCPTCVAWSAEGTKLCIGTAGGTVAVGRYDPQQKWWICRLLDEDRCTSHVGPSVETAAPSPTRASSVTALAAHPVDNTRIAVARLDGTVQVLSTYSKSVDGVLESSGEGVRIGSAGATAKPFSHVYLSHLLSCWVYGLAWSPSGQQLAVVGHDSALHVWSWGPARSPSPSSHSMEPGGHGKREAVHTAILLSQLPLLRCEFVSEDVLVAVGFEGGLHAFEAAPGPVQRGIERQRTWQLVPQHAAAQRAGSTQSAVGALAHLPRGEAASVAASDRGRSLVASGEQKTDAAAHKGIVVVVVQRQLAPIVDAPQVAFGGSLLTKSARKQAFDLFEQGNATAASAAAEDAADSSMRQHITELPTHTSPINLLVRVPSSEEAAAADSVDATFVSAGHDGRVHLWRVYHMALA
ncbi:hypothetical protein LSCM1_06738 [Leishmania martiniquensis]|uniref:Arp2/3 complex 41 kDa subunit n=1 Tax=Leishmania martiniquensis TaxID=1580590 RepID=A0A836HN63_9TRYP|nr:hypothetical protein LSCM1_06738 [Leishmania martiniquensis]